MRFQLLTCVLCVQRLNLNNFADMKPRPEYKNNVGCIPRKTYLARKKKEEAMMGNDAESLEVAEQRNLVSHIKPSSPGQAESGEILDVAVSENTGQQVAAAGTTSCLCICGSIVKDTPNDTSAKRAKCS